MKYLSVAQPSLSELDTQLESAKRLSFLEEEAWVTLDKQTERIDKMISGLIKHQRKAKLKA